MVIQYVNLGLPRDYWSGYPHIPLPGPVKMYYMMQTAFYLHLTLVINAEARRKDHWQMLTHHIITVTLIILSYTYNFTRVGCWIMFLMDLCDILLPVSHPFSKKQHSFSYEFSAHIFLRDISRLQNCSVISVSKWLVISCLASSSSLGLPPAMSSS